MPYRLDFRITFPGREPFQEAMVTYRRTQTFRPFWQDVVSLLHVHEENTFAREGAYEGLRKWAALSPEYARWKARVAPGAPILTLTGRLRRSLAGQTADSIVEIDDFRLVYGTAVPYAIYHQMGTRKMPARPMLRMSANLRARLMIALRNYLFRES